MEVRMPKSGSQISETLAGASIYNWNQSRAGRELGNEVSIKVLKGLGILVT